MDNKKFIENLLLERDKKISELEIKIASKDLKIEDLKKEKDTYRDRLTQITNMYNEKVIEIEELKNQIDKLQYDKQQLIKSWEPPATLADMERYGNFILWK